MEFSRPKYWSEWPFPSLGDLPNSGIKPRSPALQADSLPAEPPGKPLSKYRLSIGAAARMSVITQQSLGGLEVAAHVALSE